MIRACRIAILLLGASVAGCGGRPSETQEFQSNLEKAAEAAEKGKELVKSPAKGTR